MDNGFILTLCFAVFTLVTGVNASLLFRRICISSGISSEQMMEYSAGGTRSAGFSRARSFLLRYSSSPEKTLRLLHFLSVSVFLSSILIFLSVIPIIGYRIYIFAAWAAIMLLQNAVGIIAEIKFKMSAASSSKKKKSYYDDEEEKTEKNLKTKLIISGVLHFIAAAAALAVLFFAITALSGRAHWVSENDPPAPVSPSGGVLNVCGEKAEGKEIPVQNSDAVTEILYEMGYQPLGGGEGCAEAAGVPDKIIGCALVTEKDCDFEFFEFTDEESAQKFTVQYGEERLTNRFNQSDGYTEKNEGNYYLFTAVSKGYYTVIMQVGKTVVYAGAYEENSAAVDSLLSAIGYFE